MSALRCVAAALALLPLAAAGEERGFTRPDAAARLATVRTIGIVEPDVDAYELSLNNTGVPRPDWTKAVRSQVAQALVTTLRERGYAVKRFDPAAADAKEELRQVSLLYDVVAGAVLQAVFVYEFPEKVSRFEYSVGDISTLLAPEGVDALVFTLGSASISSGGRIAMIIGGSAGPGIDRLFVALVDRSGAVLWFGESDSSATDLRKELGASTLVEGATRGLPPVAQ